VLLWSKKEMQVWLHVSYWPNFQSWLIGNSPFWLEQFTLPTSEIGNMLESWKDLRDYDLPNMHSRFKDPRLPLEKLEPESTYGHGHTSGGRANDDFALTL
jgi:hypothetical protein